MEEKQNISQYRDRLDETLMSHDLSDVGSLKILVEKQMSKSSQCEDEECNDNLVQKRTKEVANFLSMLRSASGKSYEGSKSNEIPHGGWKIKHDNEDCRVMYREGPAGTPFHTLLVEGYVDGPLDVCLCISWEAGLYQKWFPQFSIPTFKVITSKCVKKVRMGEEISLVRMKLSWPLSTREALLHYVILEYLQDDLVIVLLNTISETENIDINTHGFTRDGIPDVENVTRIDVVGGFAIQKVSTNRSYFRTIANMDVKLDFLPPTVINFISRQLIGSGFKLYKKEVASVSQGDEDFSKVLKEPFYSRIREALYSDNKLPNGVSKQEDTKIVDGVLEVKTIHAGLEQDNIKIVEAEEHSLSTPKSKEAKDDGSVCEIEEVEENGRSIEDNNGNKLHENPTQVVVGKNQIIVSREVDEALGTLEKVISMFRELRYNARSLSFSRFVDNMFADLDHDHDHDHDKASNSKHFVAPSNQLTMMTSQNRFSSHSSRPGGETSYATETKDQEVGVTPCEEDATSSHGTHRSSFSFVINEALAENNTNGELKHTDESSLSKKKIKKRRFCCLQFTSGQIAS